MKQHWLDKWEREKEEHEEELARLHRVVVLRVYDATNNCWMYAQQWDDVEKAKSEARIMRNTRPDIAMKLTWMDPHKARAFREVSWR
jgi:hypothetical protein